MPKFLQSIHGKIILSIFIFLLAKNAFATADLTHLSPPYSTLTTVLPFQEHGWYMNASQIEQLIEKYSVQTVIEIGSWLGTSTRHIATLLPQDGKIYAVDHWLGSANHQGRPDLVQYLPTLYEQFLSNVIHAQLTHKIIPIRSESLEAAKTLKNITPDLIYLDASHDTESVYNDLIAWFPYVMNGKGIFCGDDWGWASVRAAVEPFAEKFNLIIHASGNFWWLEEKL